MSGGSFDYAYVRVNQFADELGENIVNSDKANEWGEKPFAFKSAVLEKLRDIQKQVMEVSELMREVEWLYSGDICEDDFMDRTYKCPVGYLYICGDDDIFSKKQLAGAVDAGYFEVPLYSRD